MNVPQETFRAYLRYEVDASGKTHEKAVQRLLALTDGPDVEVGQELLEAAGTVSETLRLYLAALRRLASYAAGQRIIESPNVTEHQTEPDFAHM